MAGLTTTTGSGAQATTQSPQASVGSGAGTAAAGSVQPGTATDLLNSSSGVALHNTSLTTVSLASTGAQTTQVPSAVPVKKHHVNAGLAGFSVVLFVLAAVLFWSAFRGEKTTTI